MTAAELNRLLRSRAIVPMPVHEWDQIAAEFKELGRHPTGMTGDIVLIQADETIAAVERPSDTVRVVRPLPSSEAAAEFVRERLAQYERMWDGCGCRIDYYA